MVDETKRDDRGREFGAEAPAGRPIGEATADDFAADVVTAGGGQAVTPRHRDEIPGAAGGGTGIGDMSGGTGIGTTDGGNDSGGTDGG